MIETTSAVSDTIYLIFMVVFAAAFILCFSMAWRWSRRHTRTAPATVHQLGAWSRISYAEGKQVVEAYNRGDRMDGPVAADAVCGRAREQLRSQENPWLFSCFVGVFTYLAVKGLLDVLFSDDTWIWIFGAMMAIGWPIAVPWLIFDRTRRHTRAARALEANRDLSPEEQARPRDDL